MHPSWAPIASLLPSIEKKLEQEAVLPERACWYRVFDMPVDQIRVVVLGQDPYHTPGKATGLAFSVPRKARVPASLRNIFLQINTEYSHKYNYEHGDLSRWIYEGVFLLNCALTVHPGTPGSHLHLWQPFTDEVIRFIATHNPNAVFILMGNFAKQKAALIPDAQRRVATCAHPSPLSARRGFFGSGVFRRAEALLGGRPINWQN
jgi:uracil-DNA glycosylase